MDGRIASLLDMLGPENGVTDGPGGRCGTVDQEKLDCVISIGALLEVGSLGDLISLHWVDTIMHAVQGTDIDHGPSHMYMRLKNK